MVILGAMLRVTQLLDMERLKSLLSTFTKNESLMRLNVRAIEAGFDAVESEDADDSLWAV
jgi:Pyruvate/2-oxoacid:ferredoxin oxidoreductase gamma subunit